MTCVTSGLDATRVTDSDATMFLMAHFVRAAGAQNGISGLWSESATCLVTVTRNRAATQVHGADLTAAELATLDWSSALVRVAGQNAKAVANGTATPVAIPDKHAEAITSRPLLLNAVGKQTTHSGQTTVTVTSLHAKAHQLTPR